MARSRNACSLRLPVSPARAGSPAMRGLLRMALTYKGALFYKMQAGMGDIVFAPFYQVLRARGVRFAFFHRVTALHLSRDRKRIDSIALGRQAVPKGDEYDPLI